MTMTEMVGDKNQGSYDVCSVGSDSASRNSASCNSASRNTNNDSAAFLVVRQQPCLEPSRVANSRVANSRVANIHHAQHNENTKRADWGCKLRDNHQPNPYKCFLSMSDAEIQNWRLKTHHQRKQDQQPFRPPPTHGSRFFSPKHTPFPLFFRGISKLPQVQLMRVLFNLFTRVLPWVYDKASRQEMRRWVALHLQVFFRQTGFYPKLPALETACRNAGFTKSDAYMIAPLALS